MSDYLILIFYAFVAICSTPSKLANETCEYVDLIELNHFYDQDARHIYDQVILWGLDPITQKFRVREWRLTEPNTDWNYPIFEAGLYRVKMTDFKTTWNIRSQLFRESWSQVDPERIDKFYHPEDERVTLSRGFQ